MTDILTRYQLDPTGSSTDNHISGEVHTLSSKDVRVCVPTYRPFFTESVTIYDNISNNLLIKGTDYVITEMLQDPTLKFGKEIAEVILIINKDISSSIRVSYQCLGGLYQNNTKGIENLYNAFLSDDRAIDWANINHKPYNFTPAEHNHMLSEVYGFGPVVGALERVKDAIVLSNIPAFQYLTDWVKSRDAGIQQDIRDAIAGIDLSIPTITESEIDLMVSNEKVVTMSKLLYAMKTLNFNAVSINLSTSQFENNSTFNVVVKTTNMVDDTRLFWTIEHIDTISSDFATNAGVIGINGNEASFTVSVANTLAEEDNETFRILIRRESVNGPILARSQVLTLLGHEGSGTEDPDIPPSVVVENNYPLMMRTCCVYSPNIKINGKSLFIMNGM